MTAQTQARSVVEQEGVHSEAPVKGATTIFQGALVVTESGLAIPGKTAVGLIVLGIAVTTVQNAGADGAKKVLTKRTTVKLFNHGADAILPGDVGKDCFIVDDQTVAKTNGTNTRSVAGKIIAVEADGVFVRVGF